jgi:hypothetical protein
MWYINKYKINLQKIILFFLIIKFIPKIKMKLQYKTKSFNNITTKEHNYTEKKEIITIKFFKV